MRLLYAEDDENDAFFMKRAVAKLVPSVKLTVVPDGRAAVDYLEGGGKYADRAAYPLPAAVLLDIKMPNLNGHEALELIRKLPAAAKMPVIMFTSSSERGDIESSRKTGANAYLVKPTDPQKLFEVAKAIVAAVKDWRTAPSPDGLLPMWGNLFGS